MSLTYGELFAGYDGLGMGVRSVLGGETSWFAEFDAAPSKILAHHYPDVPNLGDVTRIDWHSTPPVDVITGGSPCQDVSHAGKRAGMKAGTRSGLWASMCDAIDIIRPKLVVWENVRGALSAEADSAMEPCPGCLGDPDDGSVLRALGRVLGDLAELRFDARWYGLRAADVGAAHGRFRVFLFATPADADSFGCERLGMGLRPAGLQPTPRYSPPPQSDVPGQLTLLPTPSAADGMGGHMNRSGDRSVELLLPGIVRDMTQDWREYESAIRRQEAAFGRPAPPPTELGAKGQPRLSPRFVEFLMGLPEGHVTGVPGISRNDMLKALGNGVVPQQAAAATRAFVHDTRAEAVA